MLFQEQPPPSSSLSSPRGPRLLSFMDQWGDAHQRTWHFTHWWEHFVWRERKGEQHLTPPHRRLPACGEMKAVGAAPWPASIWCWRRKYKKVQTQPHVLRSRMPGLISSPLFHTRTAPLMFCRNIVLCYLLSSSTDTVRLEPGEHCGFKSPHLFGGYTLQLSSVVYNVICTFNLRLCRTLLQVINLQCHVMRRASDKM